MPTPKTTTKKQPKTPAAAPIRASKVIIAQIDRLSGQNTARVVITGSVIHPIYKKRYTKSHHLLVDTKEHPVQIGDMVSIEEGKPISKSKSWRVTKVISSDARMQSARKSEQG